MQLTGDPEAITGDEDPVEHGGPALGVEGDALRRERRDAGPAPQITRLAPPEAHRGDGLAGALDRDPQLELERLAQRRALEVRLQQLLAEPRGQERPLEPDRVAIDETQALDHEHAGAAAEAERLRGVTVGDREARAEQARADVLAVGEELAGEATELQDVVIDRRGRDERPEAMAPDDQAVALEQLERLP